MKQKSLARAKQIQEKEAFVSEKLTEKDSKKSASDDLLTQKSSRTEINDKILNLERALEINEESKQKAFIIMIQHQKYLDQETARYQQIIQEIDQIIDNCDKQIETTLHEMAGQGYDKQYSMTSMSDANDGNDKVPTGSKDDTYYQFLNQDQDIEPDVTKSDDVNVVKGTMDGYQLRQN